MTDNLHYVTAWQRNDPKLEADAIAMWSDMGVLHPSVSPEQRAKQLVTLAYVGDRLIGITTAEVSRHEPVRQNIAFMRLLLRPETERQGIAVPITIAMRETLREWSAANPAAQIAGCGIIITAKGYGAQPVLPAGLALAGYTPEGLQIRLYWWDHFRLPVA
tara:strand:- start:8020 stop:8502 length:483 start_codon:yes stop_codon:yes gene_type:complete